MAADVLSGASVSTSTAAGSAAEAVLKRRNDALVRGMILRLYRVLSTGGREDVRSSLTTHTETGSVAGNETPTSLRPGTSSGNGGSSRGLERTPAVSSDASPADAGGSGEA